MQETSEQNIDGYRFDDVTVDPAERRVEKAGAPQKITPLSFEVLAYLVRNQGRIIEKQELFERVWRESFVSDNALTRVIREIRQVIGDEAAAPRYIETVPKRGYRFIAAIEKLERENREFEKSEPLSPAAKDQKPAVQAKNRTLWLVAAFLFLIVPLGFWLAFRERAAEFPADVVYTSQLTNWSGLDNSPSISPDGKQIAYSSDRTGNFEIFVKPLAPGAREIQITSDGQQNFQPAWSPDGQRIAFYSKRRGGIWIVPASGGAAKQLTEFGSQPAFSPDGRRIAFQSGGLTDMGVNARTISPSLLWLVSSDGNESPRQLTQTGNPTGGHASPAWSPDGKRIAFNVGDVAATSVWSIELESGKAEKINASSADPVYAPDGKSVFFVSINGLWQIPIAPADGKALGEPKQIAEDGPAQIRNLSISADGKKIVYEMLLSDSRLMFVEPGKKAPQPAPLLQNSSARNTFPVFSPDGGRIAYASERAGTRSELWVMDADGQNPTQVTSGGFISNWFSDNESVAFVALREGVTNLQSFNLTGGRETTLFAFRSKVEYARLSPDNRKVAFNSNKTGTINVSLGDIASGEQRQLTFERELAGFPIWSPDGKWLALQIKRGDDTHVAIMPAEGGEITQLTDERGQSWIHSFSPDGERIVFAGQRDDVWNIYTVARTTKEQTKLTDFDKLNAYVRYPAWSPRGDRIVFEYTETTGNVWLTELK